MRDNGIASLMVASIIIGGSIGLSIRAEAVSDGCYNDQGIRVAPQPCEVAIAPDGSKQVYQGLPACKHEDGNPDGTPCIWTSKRTGLSYYVDSSEYRR